MGATLTHAARELTDLHCVLRVVVQFPCTAIQLDYTRARCVCARTRGCTRHACSFGRVRATATARPSHARAHACMEHLFCTPLASSLHQEVGPFGSGHADQTRSGCAEVPLVGSPPPCVAYWSRHMQKYHAVHGRREIPGGRTHGALLPRHMPSTGACGARTAHVPRGTYLESMLAVMYSSWLYCANFHAATLRGRRRGRKDVARAGVGEQVAGEEHVAVLEAARACRASSARLLEAAYPGRALACGQRALHGAA